MAASKSSYGKEALAKIFLRRRKEWRRAALAALGLGKFRGMGG